jgi:flavorubredoxin
VPEGVQIYSVPQEVAVEVPAIRPYKYMVVNGRVVLIDPSTSEVVAEVLE